MSLPPQFFKSAVDAAVEFEASANRLNEVLASAGDVVLRLRITYGDPNPFPRFSLFRKAKP